jgi:endoglucanase
MKMSLARTLAVVGAVLILASILAAQGATPGKKTVATPDAFAQVKRLGRGVNILGYDPIWDSPEEARFKDKHFKLIREAGFDSVRINLHVLDRLDGRNGYKIPEAWLSTLDWAVKGALANGLAVVLDLHDYNNVAADPDRAKPRILAYWDQIAAHFKDAPDGVMFELLNEPNGKLSAPLWNSWIPEIMAAVRRTNPARTVVIGPAFWNGIEALPGLKLPEDDRNIIVTVHYYHPMRFTHQGADWTPEFVKLSGIAWGSEKEKAPVRTELEHVQEWAAQNKRPILLGEFGAYDKAPMPSRVAWTSFVARTAESLGWAWAYWQFDSDFIVYDIDKDQWVKPILGALIPGK